MPTMIVVVMAVVVMAMAVVVLVVVAVAVVLLLWLLPWLPPSVSGRMCKNTSPSMPPLAKHSSSGCAAPRAKAFTFGSRGITCQRWPCV